MQIFCWRSLTKLLSCLYSLLHPQFSFIKDIEGMLVLLKQITRNVCVWDVIQCIEFAVELGYDAGLYE